MAEWTKIEDGYPLDDELVVVQFEGGTNGQLSWMEMGFFFDKHFYSINGHYDDEDAKPLRWLAIPRP